MIPRKILWKFLSTGWSFEIRNLQYQALTMYAGKPIIGIAGGVGSGKSMVARFLGEKGCFVVDSDELARRAYDKLDILQTLQGWWGEQVVGSDGKIDRRAIAERVFADPGQLRKLEALIHPIVEDLRRREMDEAIAKNPEIPAFVWDTPLLFESGLNVQCDVVIFIETPLPQRVARVMTSRGWDEKELARRENLQWPLDKKREISDYIVVNTADAGYARSQVDEVLSRTLASMKSGR
jgi:dephospho-CoA kinase